jgi:hypothetical protein
MKAIYIGDFRKTYSTENYISYGLRQNGVEVLEWQETSESSTGAVFRYCQREKPDFVLFCKNRLFGRGDVLMDMLNKAGILTVSWIFDLYFGLPLEMGSKRSIHDSPFKAKIVFTSDGGNDEQFKKIGVNHNLLRQGIHSPEAKIGSKIENIPEIVFIGSSTYYSRVKLINNLKNRYGDRFLHIGQGGDAPEIRGMNLNNVLASTKIVVGDSVPSKNYWSNRIYEILGRGGFLIHPYVEGLDSEFTRYKHYIPYEYGNINQLYEIIDFYLTHDKEREKIRMEGFNHVKKNYTYTKRCKNLINLIQKNTGIIEQ